MSLVMVSDQVVEHSTSFKLLKSVNFDIVILWSEFWVDGLADENTTEKPVLQGDEYMNGRRS